jgi:hypothetical protein
MNATSAHCLASCGTCIELDGKSRTGPSLCFQDYYVTPIYVVSAGLLLARRFQILNELRRSEAPQKWWTGKDTILVGVAILHCLYGFMMVAGGDSAEDNTVRPLLLCPLPISPEMHPCVSFPCECNSGDGAGY